MKKLFPLAGLVICIASCHSMPEAYEKGMSSMDEKKWDDAIESFNDVTKDDKDWLDSAAHQKTIAFKHIVDDGDWKKVIRVLGKNDNDDDFLYDAEDAIEQHFYDLVKDGKAFDAIQSLGDNKEKLSEYIDTTFVPKVIAACEDSLFTGLWKGRGDLKKNEIYFKREGTDLNGYSNNTEFGWPKDGIMYKQLHYISGTTWKISPRIFENSDWDESYSYFSKKGKLHVLGPDSLQVDYEALGDENIFIREH